MSKALGTQGLSCDLSYRKLTWLNERPLRHPFARSALTLHLHLDEGHRMVAAVHDVVGYSGWA